jgi:hypothetical protein
MRQHMNTKFLGKNLLFLFLLIFSGLNVFGQGRINVPGTGRGIVEGGDDRNWSVNGEWEAMEDPDTGHKLPFGGNLNRSGSTTLCLSNNDHNDIMTADIDEQHPQHGPATVHIYYRFQVKVSGAYYADFYAKTNRSDMSVELVKMSSSGDDIKASMYMTHADCDAYHFENNLDVGDYQIRFTTYDFTAFQSSIDIFVSTNDPDDGGCAPALQMSSSSSATITSGETVNISFTTIGNVSSEYKWTTNGNTNTSVTPSGPNISTALNQTITNSTTIAQTVTYTVTPTAVGGGCEGVSQLITITINPKICPTADFSYKYDDCPNAKANIRFECTSSGVGLFDECTWNFGDGTSESNSAFSSVFHQYATEGTFNVSMVLSHHSGCPNTSVTKTVTFYNPIINFSASETTITGGHTVRFTFSAGYPPNNIPALVTSLDLGNGTVIPNPVSPYDWTPSGGGSFNVKFKATDPTTGITCVLEKTIGIKVINCNGDCEVIECKNCIGSFAPEPGQVYTISAWVQQSGQEQEITYTGPSIVLDFTNGASSPTFVTSGIIIDGWQRIDGTFTVPPAATEVFVKLINSSSNDVYFDDLRIHPLKASLKSFVYDPVSMRLMAELDENNYATFYEYDEEGALIRVKKETERGVKTIKETGNSTRKKP